MKFYNQIKQQSLLDFEEKTVRQFETKSEKSSSTHRICFTSLQSLDGLMPCVSRGWTSRMTRYQRKENQFDLQAYRKKIELLSGPIRNKERSGAAPLSVRDLQNRLFENKEKIFTSISNFDKRKSCGLIPCWKNSNPQL